MQFGYHSAIGKVSITVIPKDLVSFSSILNAKRFYIFLYCYQQRFMVSLK